MFIRKIGFLNGIYSLSYRYRDYKGNPNSKFRGSQIPVFPTTNPSVHVAPATSDNRPNLSSPRGNCSSWQGGAIVMTAKTAVRETEGWKMANWQYRGPRGLAPWLGEVGRGKLMDLLDNNYS
ncbi:hypothetical protein ACH5RR_012416 [Cinchona calisaya]|uniref:Uncharacterized protein n=1 Tax=Cinchona calisaya TaxID=153742 RepID=A0ABD3ABB2_9GENT